MHTTYHLNSAQELNSEILEAIKSTFKSKAITITVEESEDDFDLTDEMKAVLGDRLNEDEGTYISSEESVEKLNENYS
ncbi:MAG: hypothetical protein ACJAZ3_001229 [Sphingobacteriales bacterium]|jgi:hypothetical protein